jgi:hypothetical protein
MFQKATVMLRLVWPNDRVFDRDEAGQGLISAQIMLINMVNMVNSKAMQTKVEHERALPVIPLSMKRQAILGTKKDGRLRPADISRGLTKASQA